MSGNNNTYRGIHGSHPETPADLLKFISYKKIASSFDEAIDLILQKKLVLGEPIAVPFYYVHKNKFDASTGEPIKTIELAFGIGSADPEHPYINCSINNSIANESVIQLEDGSTVTLKEMFDSIITQETVEQAVLDALQSEGVVDDLADKITNSPTFTSLVDDKMEVIREMLSWKSFPEV